MSKTRFAQMSVDDCKSSLSGLNLEAEILRIEREGLLQPFAPDWKDLFRIQSLVAILQPRATLEFGSGLSSLVIASSMHELAEQNPSEEFTFISLEESEEYVHSTNDLLSSLGKLSNFTVEVVHSVPRIQLVAERIATTSVPYPDISPDFVYLDGPSPAARYPSAGFNGFKSGGVDGFPMSGDLLLVEYFFKPGAVILVDGRTANARFLRDAFRQDWWYLHDEEEDVHYFQLVEPPLGSRNKRSINDRFEGKRLSELIQ